MCRLQCLVTLVAVSLLINIVHSWDLAVTTGNRLEFYTNKTKTSNEGFQFRDLTALAYDAVHNMLLFVDKQSDNASIFSFNLSTKKYQPLVRRRDNENIQGLAFDPVKGMLYWTDNNEKSIFWISLQPGSNNSEYGNLLMRMDDKIPRAIAVDSCRGFLYWTNINITKPTIERHDGIQSKVIVDSGLYMPVSIAVDQRTKRLYWADDKEGIHYSIESSDFDGNGRQTLHVGIYHQPNSLTVSKDYIYWVDVGYNSVWKLPKNAKGDKEPEEIISFRNEKPSGIEANYPIAEQTQGIAACSKLMNLSQNESNLTLSDTIKITTDSGLYCVHGEKINGKSLCKCSAGYTGERCDISLCQNYCFNGDCINSENGQPICRCKPGYVGIRCEIDICHNYCLNEGHCSVNLKQEPVCTCPHEFTGAKCENQMVTEVIPTPSTNMTKNLTDNVTMKERSTNSSAGFLSESISPEEDFVEASCYEGWDSVRDPIIMVLGIICGLLCVTCTFLFTKILHLKRRPRIKKRIIVNKNVTPMTARPDQCEITIENCCNMNICETPCFEPRSTIRPTILNSKSGKEEKKNLIANMEYPEDLY